MFSIVYLLQPWLEFDSASSGPINNIYTRSCQGKAVCQPLSLYQPATCRRFSSCGRTWFSIWDCGELAALIYLVMKLFECFARWKKGSVRTMTNHLKSQETTMIVLIRQLTATLDQVLLGSVIFHQYAQLNTLFLFHFNFGVICACFVYRTYYSRGWWARVAPGASPQAGDWVRSPRVGTGEALCCLS